MTAITLVEAKAHLKVDHDAEDDVITLAIEAAEDYVSQYLERDLPWTDGSSSEVLPASVKAAILLVVGDLHRNREGRFVGTIQTDNPAVHALLAPYRVNLGV